MKQLSFLFFIVYKMWICFQICLSRYKFYFQIIGCVCLDGSWESGGYHWLDDEEEHIRVDTCRSYDLEDETYLTKMKYTMCVYEEEDKGNGGWGIK